MSGTLTHSTTLTTLNCGESGCGIAFAIPSSLNQRALDDHSVNFYCPNGHYVGYSGESPRKKAEREADELRRRLASREEDVRAARASLVATKGHLTRQRQRAARAMCPVPGCKRHFVNVQRHVEGQHPEWVEAHR